MAAEAPAAEHDPVGIDMGQGQGEIDHGADHVLPVGAQGDPLLDQRLALAGGEHPRPDDIGPRRRDSRDQIDEQPLAVRRGDHHLGGVQTAADLALGRRAAADRRRAG